MSGNIDDSANESILYEVLEYLIRKQEPELTVNNLQNVVTYFIFLYNQTKFVFRNIKMIL